MNARKLIRPLFFLFSLVCVTANAQEISESTDPNPENSDVMVSSESVQLSYESLNGKSFDTLTEGRWIWGLLTESLLSGGATSVTSDASLASTFYVGGLGYIAVSQDSGATWREAVSFQHWDSGLDDENEGEILDSERPMVAERRREVIREEISVKFGGEEYADALIQSAESILDNISDDELLEANYISDIDELDELELDMDPNLNHIHLENGVVSENGSYLSDYDSYIERYLSMINRGALPEKAILKAADSPAVWQIESMSLATFAVTSDVVYMTTDKGATWQNLVSCPGDESCLSVAVSNDGNVFVVGMTNGLMLTQDGGENWMIVTDGLDGAFFDVSVLDNGSKLLAVSTSHLYESNDFGNSWHEVDAPISSNEVILDVAAGAGGRMLVLTTDDLYYVESGDWSEIGYRPFAEETLRGIAVKDPSLSNFVVLTDRHVFEFNNGWMSQNKALFSTGLGHFAYLRDNISLGIMVTSSGVWMAQDISIIEDDPEFQMLKDKWAREPSNEMVLYQALEAHYLGSTLDTRWGLRSWLAWILPRVDFQYMFQQTRQDDRKTVVNGKSAIQESDEWTSKRQTNHEWQIMGYWEIRLDRIEMNHIARESMLANLRDDRIDLINKVNAELAKRHALEMTLVLELPKLPENARDSQKKSLLKKQLKAQLSLDEAESHLNYLTGGYYLPAIQQNH